MSSRYRSLFTGRTVGFYKTSTVVSLSSGSIPRSQSCPDTYSSSLSYARRTLLSLDPFGHMERSSSPVQYFQQQDDDPRFWNHLFPGATPMEQNRCTSRIRSRSADLPARPNIPQNSSPTAPTGSSQTTAVHASFYTGDYVSDDDYNSLQDSPRAARFGQDANSARRSAPPVDYVLQPSERPSDPQPGQHLQVPHQTPVNRRLRGEAKPFNRVSKTGKSHFVTPAAACIGFQCTFTENGQPCSETDTFKLPSAIREHLIAKHMEFSPFQCSNCKRVFTRLALETRHLQKHDTGDRTCPNEPQMEDKNYQARCSVRDALWEIRTKQGEVDKAVLLIKKYNGQLEGRKRRGAQRDPTSPGDQSPPPGSGTFLPTGQPSHSHSHSHTLNRHHSHSPSRSAFRDSTPAEFQYISQHPQFGHTLQHQHQATNYHTTQHPHQTANDWQQLQQPRHPQPPQFAPGYSSQFAPPSSGADPNNLFGTNYHT